MEITEVQAQQIEWELAAKSMRDPLLSKIYEIANKRLLRLLSGGFYLEIILVNSQVFEHIIKQILYGYGVKRRILSVLGENDPYAHIPLDVKEDEPLGLLIGLLARFTGKTPLIEKLNRFNNGLRKEVAHHIFDGSKDIEPFEDQIKEFFGEGAGSQFCEIRDGLREALNSINKQIEELTEKTVPEKEKSVEF